MFYLIKLFGDKKLVCGTYDTLAEGQLFDNLIRDNQLEVIESTAVLNPNIDYAYNGVQPMMLSSGFVGQTVKDPLVGTLKAKVASMLTFNAVLNSIRSSIIKPLVSQDVVYARKLSEAQAILASKSEDTSLYPYMSQYAMLKGVSLQDAAKTVVAASKAADDVLLQTEGLRMKYLSQYEEAVTADDVAAVTKAYRQELGL